MELKTFILRLVKNCLELEASLGDIERNLKKLGESNEHIEEEITAQLNDLPEERLSIKDRTPEINHFILVHYFQKLANAIVEVAQCEAFRISSICGDVCYETINEDAYRQKILDALRWRYKDFEHYREDMIAILETLPKLENDTDFLPILYCISKQKGHV